MNDTTSTQNPVTHRVNLPGGQLWIFVVLILAVVLLISLVNQPASQQLCRLFEDYETTSSEKHRILMALGSSNLTDFAITDGQICVSRLEQAKYLAAIRDQNALPNIYEEQQDLKINPFMLKSQQKQQALDRKKQLVRNMILRLPFVSEVMFEIDSAQSENQSLHIQQSAVVLVSMAKQTALSHQQVTTIQGIVSGAFAGIRRQDVVVTDANVGISYGDLKDPKQSALIELVNWQIKRQEFYLDRLHDLTYEYPGLEISVDVKKQWANSIENSPQNKVATDIPAKFASRSTYNEQRPRMALNSAGTVSDNEPDSLVVTASYLKSVNDASANSINNADNNSEHSEIVRIRIRIPADVIKNHQLTGTAENMSDTNKFESLKSEIVQKVKQLVPTLPASAPISVAMIDQHASKSKSPLFENSSEWLRLCWPFGTVALFGLLAIFWSRKATVKTEPVVAPHGSIPADSQLLQSQLSNLIDDDPVAAANVIKNWIRKTG